MGVAGLTTIPIVSLAEGSEGHVKAEVEKGLHVKQQLAARGGVVLQGSPGSLRPPGFQFETWGGLWIRGL